MAENKSNKKNIDIESEVVRSLYGKRIREKGQYLSGEELYKETIKILNSLNKSRSLLHSSDLLLSLYKKEPSN